MRIALLSDVHGNSIALDVVLADIAAAGGADADLICVGHTHVPLDVTVDGVRIVNLGSVSNPLSPDLRASYALLDADARGCCIERRRVAYDHAVVIRALRERRHPAPEYIIRFQQGLIEPAWRRESDVQSD